MPQRYGGLGMFQPEPISAVLTAVALILTAIGGFAFRRGAEKGKAPDPAEEMRKALDANTAATALQSAHFEENNRMFKALAASAAVMADRLREIERNSTHAIDLAKDIHTEIVRRGK